ncbi:MAG: lamin tail domain-containing protein [Candidatus Levybacteria bacterium]|nr:lamin tail domain-containing protein [Candidatus Levybacteria bacterium]
MRTVSRIFLLSSLTYAFIVLLIIANGQPLSVKADTNHVVISQIQLSGATASDEFVELYNPTNSNIDLAKWRLIRKSSTGGSTQNLVASLAGTIKPKSYFLIAHPNAALSANADTIYSSSASAITTNNTITLFSDAGLTIVDKIGLGTAVESETAPFADNPEGGESIVRKAIANSTAQSLFTGGTEATLGNGLDTDNNSTDFVLFTVSLPRNSTTSQTQPTSVPSSAPTNTPSPTSVPTPTSAPTAIPTTVPTNTPTPTQMPTATPIPTTQPTSTPIPTATPLPTTIPTPTKTPTPTPTKVPTPTATVVPTMTSAPTPTTVPTIPVTPMPTAIPTPTMTPAPTPTPEVIVEETLGRNRKLVCTQSFKTLRILGFQFSIPKVSCSIIKS